MAKKSKLQFYTDARSALKKGMNEADIQELATFYTSVTQTDIQKVLKESLVNSAISIVDDNEKKKGNELYKIIDQKFILDFSNIVAYRRGTNTTFYQYTHGVYEFIDDSDMFNMVSTYFLKNNLLDHRAKKTNVDNTISRIASLLSSMPERYFRDSDVVANNKYINLKNGLFDPQTKVLDEHTPKYFSVTQIPFNYDATADCPKFKEFIKFITQKNEGSDRMIQEMFGYFVCTDGNPRHKIHYLYGATARNGKSTTAQIVAGLLGSSNISHLSLQQIAQPSPSTMESLVGKRLNFSDEVSGNFLQSGNLTSISAEGTIDISPKFKPPYPYKVTCKFVVACNSIPRLSENNGMKQRMIVIPFDHHIPEGERILNYDKVLLEEEGSGILNWAIEGAEMLGDSFFVSKQSDEEMQENILASNNVLAFLDSDYTYSDTYTDAVFTQDMYGSKGDNNGYIGYCYKTSTQPMAYIRFCTEIKTFAKLTKKIEYKKQNNGSAYIGLRHKNESEETLQDVANQFN